MTTTRSRRSYDHRIKEQIIRAENPDLFPELEISRSTALSWIRRGIGDVVGLDDEVEVEAELRARIVALERRVSMLTAVLRLGRNRQRGCRACPRSSPAAVEEDEAA